MNNDIVECPSCGHLVPAGNMAIHSVHGCQAASTSTRPAHLLSAAQQQQQQQQQEEETNAQHETDTNHHMETSSATELEESSLPEAAAAVAFIPPAAAAMPEDSSSPASFRNPFSTTTFSPPTGTSQNPISLEDSNNSSSQRRTRRDTPSSPCTQDDDDRKPAARRRRRTPPISSTDAGTHNEPYYEEEQYHPHEEQNEDHYEYTQGTSQDNPMVIPDTPDTAAEAVWSCPECTLDNPLSVDVCQACGNLRPGATRPADPVRREQLLTNLNHDTTTMMHPLLQVPPPASSTSAFYNLSNDQDQDDNNQEFSALGRGALVGGLLGAGAAYMQGRDLTNGAIGGAVSGGVGGVLLSEMMRNGNSNSTTTTRRTTSTQPQGRTTRTVVRRGPNGTTTTTVTTSSFSTAGRRRNNANAAHTGEPALDQLLLALMQRGSAAGIGGLRNHPNIDAMNYEQLLAAFGDGSEHRGADAETIATLPTSRVEDPDRLPQDHKQCMICLEDYQAADSRTTLPCLHGFHTECATKWLQQNASCPICKHSVRS